MLKKARWKKMDEELRQLFRIDDEVELISKKMEELKKPYTDEQKTIFRLIAFHFHKKAILGI
jgi:hypothetical protein